MNQIKTIFNRLRDEILMPENGKYSVEIIIMNPKTRSEMWKLPEMLEMYPKLGDEQEQKNHLNGMSMPVVVRKIYFFMGVQILEKHDFHGDYLLLYEDDLRIFRR